MADRPVPLSPIALRLAGHVGQTALDRVATGGVAILAQLDQHVAAVRAELAACNGRPVTKSADQLAGARLRRKSRHSRDARGGLRRGQETGSAGAAAGGMPSPGEAICPDVPFAATALHTEATVAVELLLHYACGFVQAAVSDGWLPEVSADADDWVSLRLASVCLLIRQTEAAAAVHPDLRASA